MQTMLKLLLILVALLSTHDTLADSYTELYVEPGAANASNINGGSSRARLFRRTNGNWNSSTRVFTATGDTLDSAWIGEVACVIADGGTTGAYFAVVTAVDNTAKTITLSVTRTLGTAPSTSATARTITIGGAWTGMSGTTAFPFNIVTWQSLKDTTNRVRINLCGSFSVTSSLSQNSNSLTLRGYGTTPGDGGLATITYTGAGNTYTMTTGGSGYHAEYESLWFKNKSTSATRTSCFGLVVNPSSGVGWAHIRKCRFSDCAAAGLYGSGGASEMLVVVEGCEFFDCAKSVTSGTDSAMRMTGSAGRAVVRRSLFHHNTASSCAAAIGTLFPIHISETVFDSNTTSVSVYDACLERCAFYGNTTAISGNTSSSGYHIEAINCIFEQNTTVATTSSASAGKSGLLRACAFFNNATILSANATSSDWVNSEASILSGSAFVDAANGDFRTRSTLLRNAIDGTLLQSSSYYSKTTQFRRDIGLGPSNPFYRGQ